MCPEARHVPHLVLLRIDVSLGSVAQLDCISQLTGAVPTCVQIEIDTGMGRGGFLPGEITEVAARLGAARHVQVVALWSHLARSCDTAPSACQRDALLSARECLGLQIPCHLVATGGLILGERFHLHGARIGLGCLGLVPETLRESLGLKLAIHWTANLAAVYERPAGAAIGYGGDFRLVRASRLGLVPVGFSDGYPRLRHGVVGIAGELAPIVGTVGMTSMVIDLTDIDPQSAREGGAVQLLSETGPDVDALLRTCVPAVIPNSFVCGRTDQVATKCESLDARPDDHTHR
jgi:alanine racemase